MIEYNRTGKPGRPKAPIAVVNEDLDYATVRKKRVNGVIVEVERTIVYGDAERIQSKLKDTPSKTINTAFVERLNGTLRQCDSHIKRKANTFARSLCYFKAKIYMTSAIYNFCRPHGTLSRNSDRTTTKRTPAMIAGITDHVWNIIELLGFRVV
jgi:IS1 family transposase